MMNSRSPAKEPASAFGWRRRLVPRVTALQDGDPPAVAGFSLAGRIGEGVQAIVYLGVNEDGEAAAVKVLRSGRLTSMGLQAFANEVRAIQVAPDSISPRYYCSGRVGESRYMASEYLRGASLEQLIRRNGPLAGPALSQFAVALCAVVVSLHGRGIEHGDIKARHVITGPGGRVFLIDFGIAAFGDARLRRRDLFNLAAVILYAGGGNLPYQGTPLEISTRTMAGKADVSVLPAFWRDTMRRCLDPNQRRCPSAADVLRVVSG
jgi:serine/threonine protein kinase